MPRTPLAVLALVLTTGCSMPGWLESPRQASVDERRPVEATSLLGEPLRRPVLDEEFQRQQEDHLSQARAVLRKSPDELDPLIWIGRRSAYLGRYGEAIDRYSEGLERFTEPRAQARLYRHRGHRYLTVRRLEEAEADLKNAAVLIQDKPAVMPDRAEEDGLPNAAGIPTSTLATNVWYHLGLALYLQGEYERAAAAYRGCLEASTHKDMYVAGAYWRYLALRRAGRAAEASQELEPIRPDMKLLESHAYHRLLLMFAERLRPEDLLDQARQQGGVEFATTAYGVAAWHDLTGDVDGGQKLLREIVARPEWHAFGHLAAEADLARRAAAEAESG